MAYDSLQPTPVFRMTSGTREDPNPGGVPGVGGEDPTEEPGDRLAVHGIWEALLGVVTVLVAVAVHQINDEALFGPGLEAFLLVAASFGLGAVGMGWSVRAGVPNLAVGPIMVAAAMLFARQAEGGLGFSFAITLAAAAAAGVLLAIVVVGLQVPGWAASLALAVGVGAWLSSGGRTELPDAITYHPGDHAVYWFIGFATVSLLGGLVGLSAPMRRLIGGFRPQGDPAERQGLGAGMGAVTALLGSCLFAATAGTMTALIDRGAAPDSGLGLTGLALGVVLIGGTSAYGRRAGLAGTFFGVVLLTLVMRLAIAERWQISELWYATVAVVLGLLVTRLVEAKGQPRAAVDSDDDQQWQNRPDQATLDTTRTPLALPSGGVAKSVVRGEVLTGEAVAPGSLARPGSPVLQGRIGDRAMRVRYPALGSASAGGAPRPLLHIRPWDNDPLGGPRKPGTAH